MNDLLDHHKGIDQDTSSLPPVNGQPAVADDKPSPASKKPSIGREVHSFIKHIDSLADTLPLAMLAIQGARKEAVNAIEEFERDHCDVKELSEGQFRIGVPIDKLPRFKQLHDRAERPRLAARLVPQSFVVSLISQYDAFLGALIRTLFYLKPEAVNSSERTVSFAELMAFGSVEAAREYLIENEVETVLRKSHSEQFDWLENKFGLPLRKGLDVWPTFIEVTERRNLFVHASGLISRQYLDVCAKHKATLPNDAALGKGLGVSKEYFTVAHEAIFEVGVKLAHVLWRKLKPEDMEGADKNLIDLTFELLTEERYQLARVLLDFAAETIKKYSSEVDRRTLIMNRAQAYKWLGHETKAREIVMAEDWTASNNLFHLAEAVLLDEFARAALHMRRIGPKSIPSEAEYMGWPLFREFRQSKEFETAFEKVFGKPATTSIETAAAPCDEPRGLSDAIHEAA
jgi:hypothetical protein